MYLSLLDSNLVLIDIIDAFKSLMWIDRYDETGDFELVLNPNQIDWTVLANTKYFRLEESENLMILELINIHTDSKDGDELILKGRDLSAYLERRIIWNVTVLTGNFQDGIKQLLDDNVISPSDPNREISEFIFEPSIDPIITSLEIDNQFFGEYILETISTLCKSKGIGFKVILDSSNNFEFNLYAGVDHSYDQSTNPYIVFSTDFDNLLTGDYITTDKFLKNIALVLGEKGISNLRTSATVGTSSGLDRRELFVDAANIVRNTPEGLLTDEQYLNQLEGKGIEELSKYINIESFDGEIDPTRFVFGDDYGLGDIVQVADSYGHSSKSRVNEIVYNQDETGKYIYPTFTTID